MDQDKSVTENGDNINSEEVDNRTPVQIVTDNIKKRYIDHPNDVKYVNAAYKKLVEINDQKTLQSLFNAILEERWRAACSIASDVFQRT